MKTVQLPKLLAGYHISNAAKNAIALAQKEDAIAEFDFNGVTVSVTKHDTEGDVIAQFQRLMDAAHTRYLASDEYKAEQARAAEAARVRPIIFREKVQALATMTEAQLREFDFPSWPETQDEVDLVILTLEKRSHDYGTCCYAMSIAAYAAFCYMASKLGTTGFQASCADLDILRRTRLLKGPFMIIKAEDQLYPQCARKWDEAIEGWKPWLKEQAEKNLAEKDSAHPNVVEHWEKLAK